MQRNNYTGKDYGFSHKSQYYGESKIQPKRSRGKEIALVVGLLIVVIAAAAWLSLVTNEPKAKVAVYVPATPIPAATTLNFLTNADTSAVTAVSLTSNISTVSNALFVESEPLEPIAEVTESPEPVVEVAEVQTPLAAQPSVSEPSQELLTLAALYGASEEIQQYLDKGKSADDLLFNLQRYDATYKRFKDSGRLDGLGEYVATAEELASWESIGSFNVVGYDIWDGAQCGWNIPTGLASSRNKDPIDDAAVPGLTCAISRGVALPGTVLYIEGYGKVYVNDTGNLGNSLVDLAFDNNADCYARTGKLAVYVVSRP
jgi:hypothetical protein